MPKEEKPTSDKKKEKPWRPNESQMVTVQLEEEPKEKNQDASSEENSKKSKCEDLYVKRK